ncbi:MAG: tRNA pseudouridine(55) synthase TruB [Oscillospiraceae bacterium]|jgi:tRNA pseudouridine55 synthase|nr:tRNA pseudouridine(55) synthase TruB [Oscillospiraceae bacterium]
MLTQPGVILLDKPSGVTSFSAMNRVRKALRLKKAGHTGTLDPMATGVLVILTEGAARFIEYLPERAKSYRARFELGLVTDTQDTIGNVVGGKKIPVSMAQMQAALAPFRGKISQTPPMVSAVKHEGKRLYALARQGLEVERAPREIEISRLELLDEHTMEIDCSAGTYIRTLIHDWGQTLGCGAVLSALRRTRANGYDIQQCATIEQIEQGEFCVIPIENALECYPRVEISSAQAVRFQNGGALDLARVRLNGPGELHRVFGGNSFLGLGKTEKDQLKIEKLLVK